MHSPVIRRRRPGFARPLISLLAGVILATASLSTAGPAAAQGVTGPTTTANCQSVDGNATCQSGVTFRFSGSAGTKSGGGPSDWTPPACWYEPTSVFTPELLQAVYQLPLFGILVVLLTGGDTGTNFDFHANDKGNWWDLVYNPAMPDAQTQCTLAGPILVWVPDAAPAPQEAVTTWKMAAAARNMIPVDAPALTLKPGPGNQIVNLPTLVSFTDRLPRTWVTASLNVDGYTLAATTVATPASITVDAGTPNASPSSCTYQLASDSSGTYQVDPNRTTCNDGSSGPNAGIVYRRPTAAGATYPLTATMTWKVTWTDTASPDSPPQANPTLPDLTVTSPAIPVVAKEVETINH
jgi:enoyl reductase